MSGRTPSFIVVGLVIIMFLLGLFYMSCSSKNNELRQSLEEFEERIRSLTMRNSDFERKIESINTRKRELEEEKTNVQRQMEKKDSEINELNIRVNRKEADMQSLRSDKQAFEEQLKEFKIMSDTLGVKNSQIEKLQQQLDEQKRSKDTDGSELSRLREEFNSYKQRVPQKDSVIDAQQPQVPMPRQRFSPLGSNNEVNGSNSGSFFRAPLEKLSNLTNEIKEQIIPAARDAKDRVLGALGVGGQTSSNTSTFGQQPGGVERLKENQLSDQNVPAPPLANNAQRQQQPGHVESAQIAPGAAAPLLDKAEQALDNANIHAQRAVNNNENEKKNIDNEDDDADDLENNVPPPSPPNPDAPGIPHPVVAPPRLVNDDKNYRVAHRGRRVDEQRRRLDNGEEILDEHDLQQQHQIGKKNLL